VILSGYLLTMQNQRKKYHVRAKPLLSFTSEIPWKPRADDSPMMVGYVRVSMSHQNTQRQVDDLVAHGVAPVDIFGDKASGKDMERPGWKACMRAPPMVYNVRVRLAGLVVEGSNGLRRR
jgi:hypothetical protein